MQLRCYVSPLTVFRHSSHDVPHANEPHSLRIGTKLQYKYTWTWFYVHTYTQITSVSVFPMRCGWQKKKKNKQSLGRLGPEIQKINLWGVFVGCLGFLDQDSPEIEIWDFGFMQQDSHEIGFVILEFLFQDSPYIGLWVFWISGPGLPSDWSFGSLD